MWWLLLAAAPPDTVTVAILSRHRPTTLAVSSPGCPGLPGTLKVQGKQVAWCAPDCETKPRFDFRCDQPILLQGSFGRRRYGNFISVEVERGHLRVLTTVPLETYVRDVVAAEDGQAPLEAQRALAIVARSFARRAQVERRHPDATVCDLTHCQVYRGESGLSPDPAQSTAGLALLSERGPAPVFFHGSCGGHTVDAHAVWPELPESTLIGIEDVDPGGRPWCAASAQWRTELEAEQLASILGPWLGHRLDAASLRLSALDPSGLRWQVGDRRGMETVAGHGLQLALGRALGWNRVRSSRFVAERRGNLFWLKGQGQGHAVGLCQAGAAARAKAGQTAEEIIQAYFPRLRLR